MVRKAVNKKVVAELVKSESTDEKDTSIAASIRVDELRKNLIRTELSSLEKGHAEKLCRMIVNKEDDPTPLWYFTHV